MLRLGIIGYGVQGKLYAAILTGGKAPANCCLAAVCVHSAASLERTEKLPGIAYFSDWKKMLESSLFDAVVITTPHYSHAEIAIAAMDAGKHVLCEKPAAIRASNVEKMLACADSHPELTLALMLNQRTNPLFQKLKAVIGSGELGTLRRSNWIITNWWRPDSYYRANAWRGTWHGEGGGVLVNQAPHQLDLWLWLCGKPKKIFAKCIEGAHRDITVENDVTILAEYENGATGCFVTCTHDPLGTDRLELDFSRGKIVVEDSRRATICRFRLDETVWNNTLTQADMAHADPDTLYEKEEITGASPYGSAYARMFENFADHIFTGAPLIAPAADGLAPVQLANTAQLSGWLGQELSFPCDSKMYDRWLADKIQKEAVDKP